jgi:hypothetical protein
MKPIVLVAVALAATLGAVTLVSPAYADEHRGGREEGHFRGPERGHDAGRWHGGGIEHFHERDVHMWREGHWEHRYRDGRYGWWWLAGGFWYFYPAPIYPYPDPYVPPVVVAPPAPPPAVAAAPPPPQYWYYCDSASGYYPYVPSCLSGWRPVPASPAY